MAQGTTQQSFHQGSLNQTDAPRQAQHQKCDVKRQAKRFHRNCFYCNKPAHREAEWRQKARDRGNGTVKQRQCKPANLQETRQPFNL